MSTIQEKLYTPADLLAMPESGNIELVDGNLVEKPVSVYSGLVVLEIGRLLRAYCRSHKLGFVLPAACGIRCFRDDPDKVLRPGISFVQRERLASARFQEGSLSIAPDLAIEVVATHEKVTELNRRVEDYLAARVALIWEVYPDSRIVIVHRKDGSVAKFRKNDEITGEDVIPGFKCSVVEFFPPIPI